MQIWKPAALALAVGALYPCASVAQTNKELQRELEALKGRIGELEKQLATRPPPTAAAAAPVAAQPPSPPGVTAEQSRELNRVAVKTDALEESQETLGFKGLKIGGFIDPTYIYNQRQDRAGFQFLNRVNDDGYNYDNGYFGLAGIDFQKEMEGGTLWRLTLIPQRGAGAIADTDGNSIVHEASVSVPLKDLQTRLIAGQIPDWSGYESVLPHESKLVTRGLLLDFAAPTAYTAAGLDLVRGDWQIQALLGNYNSTKSPSGHRSPVLAYRVDYAKGEFSGFGFAGVHGKAANLSPYAQPVDGDTTYSRLDLIEADAYYIRGDWTLQGQLSFGRQRDASIVPAADGSLRTAQWWGASVLAAYKFMPRWEAVARLDYVNNQKNGGGLLQYSVEDGRNGIGPNATLGCTTTGWVEGCDRGANRYALALGLNYMFSENVLMKAEYRYDGASQPVFYDVKRHDYSRNNSLLGASVVVFF